MFPPGDAEVGPLGMMRGLRVGSSGDRGERIAAAIDESGIGYAATGAARGHRAGAAGRYWPALRAGAPQFASKGTFT